MRTTAEMREECIENYLTRLSAALGGVAAEDKQDILREIRAHIVDSAEASKDRESAIERTLRLLGEPEELAARYRTECMLTRASRSFSPWTLLSTSWRWATLGIKGTLAFLLGLFGYATASGLTIAVFLKPFMPSRVGMWVGSEGLNIGVPSHPERMHELLGQWFIPVMAVAAFLIAIGTTQGLRRIMRKRTSAVPV